MEKIIAVISGKGGVGKSTVSSGMGYALSTLGKRVLLVDCDSKLRCLDLMLSTTEKTLFDMSDVISGECGITDAAVPVDNSFGLYVVSAARDNSVGERKEDFVRIIRQAGETFDFIILDAPAGVGNDFYSAVSASDTVLVVATPEPVSIRDAETAAGTAENISACETRLVINKLDYKLVKKRLYANADNMIDGTKVRLIGIVPDDTAAHEAAIKGTVIKKGRAHKAFLRIAKRLCGENIPLPKAKKI